MLIEDEIFKNWQIDYNKIIAYGFIKVNDSYCYSKNIMNDTFRVDINVNSKGYVKGHIYDLKTNEEYFNFRLKDMSGSFVSQIKDEYLSILKDIRDKCFESNLHFFAQTKRIVKQIDILYHDKPLFLWQKYPKYAVFKNSSSNKWYAIIMNIDKSKLMLDSSDEVEIINLKLSSDKVLNLLTKKGFYPAYHMNKKNWLSIILDNTLLDQDILDLISESYAYTNIK